MKINISFDEIKQKTKSYFNNFVHEKIYQNVFDRLNEEKKRYSKVSELEYNALGRQKYLQANSYRLNKEEAQLIFKLRSRTVDVKGNMKWNYADTVCDGCGEEDETQEHVFYCESLREEGRNRKVEYEKIEYGSVEDKAEAADIFKEILRKLKTLRKNVPQ